MAEITKMVPRIHFAVRPRHRNIKNPEGPIGRIDRMRKILSQLFKYERIELNLPICDEVRGYAERLVCEAIRHGDQHPPTMDMADFWLFDKQMVHKLFKVLAPRYENYKTSVTDMHLIPIRCNLATGPYVFRQLCVLEMKAGTHTEPPHLMQHVDVVLALRLLVQQNRNPYPPMPQKSRPNSASLTNILLKEASKEFRKMKLNSEATDKKN